jgi:hypothetical protein
MLRERRTLANKLPNSLSYKHLLFDGVEREMAVLDSDNLNQKTIYAMPGEKVRLGGMVEWMNNHWLVTTYDADDELQGKGMMQQCNYLLRWVAKDNTIVERWCIVEDGTKLKRMRLWAHTQWFGVLETLRKKNPFNCWNTLRATVPKRNSEQL